MKWQEISLRNMGDMQRVQARWRSLPQGYFEAMNACHQRDNFAGTWLALFAIYRDIYRANIFVRASITQSYVVTKKKGSSRVASDRNGTNKGLGHPSLLRLHRRSAGGYGTTAVRGFYTSRFKIPSRTRSNFYAVR